MTPTEQLELIGKQATEVLDFRQRQLQRDGRIYDPILHAWILLSGRVEKIEERINGK